MIDTHAHLYVKEFSEDIQNVIKRAENAGVTHFFLPAIDSESHEDMLSLEKKFPQQCFAMMGVHPCSIKENYLEEISIAKSFLAKQSFAGIGEAGLDFYWDKTFTEQQHLALDLQAEMALEYGLPLILHTRNSMQETIQQLKKYKGSGLTGIFHCFSGSEELANEIIKLGFMMGIGGVVTYKNSGLNEVLKNISLHHLVLETDAPYLTPVPHRGKRNESSYIPIIADKIAEIKGTTQEAVADATTNNAKKIFQKSFQ